MTDPGLPSVVAVLGSCPTRDNFNSTFNPDYGRWFSCRLTANQTAMVTMMSPPLDDVEWKPLKPMNGYNQWNVTSDLTREFLPLVAELRPEYVVLDFFADVHFGVLRLPDGRYATDNRWKLHHTDWYAEQQAEGAFTRVTIQDDTEEYLALWRDAIDRFAAHLTAHSPETTVVVHRGWNTKLVAVPGRIRPMRLRRHKPVQAFDVALGNELWGRLDDYCLTTFGWESIDLRGEEFTSWSEHPWGAFYVHYEPEYYHRFLAELHKIHLRRTGTDPDVLDRLLAVEEAARESGERRRSRAQGVADAQAETIERQRARIQELETLGVARSMKFAVGQRLRARTSARTSTRTKEQR